MKWFVLFIHLLFGIVALAGEPMHTEGLLNKLLAPGPLIEGHKQLEGADCLKCHEPGKGVPSSKCMACHKEIAADVANKHGFHGLTAKTCIQCHGDHKGRRFDSTKVNQRAFNHKLTGFRLTGKHQRLKCSECHTETRASANKFLRGNEIRFFGAKNRVTCVSCHLKDNPHLFKGKWAEKDCSACHGPNSWHKEITFDHNRDTRYKLEGKHAEVKCATCHVPTKGGPSRYEWKDLSASKCLACHEDQHKGNLGPKFQGGECLKCHGQVKWKITSFDHRLTDYPLKGKHAVASCIACHKQTPKVAKTGLKNFDFTGLRTECVSCHENPHASVFSKDALAARCTECHTEQSWKVFRKDGFNHDRRTRFVLTGKHLGLRCEKCHQRGKTQIFHFPSFAKSFCVDCHKNIHVKEFAQNFSELSCKECHSTANFTKRLEFNHDRTNFRLTGKHSRIACNRCHVRVRGFLETVPPRPMRKFLFASADKNYCVDCHANPHIGQFHGYLTQTSCVSCHTTDDFTHRTPFNHDRTYFPLKWKHRDVACAKCHVRTQATFRLIPPPFPPHRKSRFLFPEMATKDCQTCHKDPHEGKFGAQCSECHSEREWKQTTDFHKDFSLSGVHYALQCAECHRDGRRLTGMSDNCQLCHQKDDIHNGTLPNCGQCHRQEFWNVTAFKHSMTSFPLRGIHRTLDCYSCHYTGTYAGLRSDCASCHTQAAINFSLAGGIPNHVSGGLLTQDCFSCHNQFSFK